MWQFLPHRFIIYFATCVKRAPTYSSIQATSSHWSQHQQQKKCETDEMLKFAFWSNLSVLKYNSLHWEKSNYYTILFFVPIQIFASGHFPSSARSRDLHFSKNLCRFSGFQRRTVCKHCECGKAWIQFSELLNSWSNSKYYHHDHFHGNGLISFPPRHNMANRVQFVLRWWMCVTAAAAVVDGTRVEKHQQLKFDQVYLPVYLRTSVISTLHVLSLSSPSIGLSHNSHDDAWPS